MVVIRNIARATCFLLLAIVVSSCTTHPMIRNAEIIKIGSDKNVFLTAPVVECKDIRNEYSNVACNIDWLASYLQDNSLKIMSGRGFPVKINSGINEILIRLKGVDSTFDIFKNIQGSDSEAILREFADVTGSSYILFIKATIYKGPGGSFNPFLIGGTGITSEMNRTRVKAMMIDIPLNKVVWRNEAQYDNLPDVSDDKLMEMMTLLYSTVSK